MRYLSLFFLVIFVWFAFLQINDPDPVWWITLYLVPAYVSFKAFKNEFSFELLRILFVLYLALALNTGLNISNYEGFFTEGEGMEMKTINQELAREAAGLGICVVVYLVYILFHFRYRR